jgi:hypothetical protein
VNGTIFNPIDWINERLKQKGYFSFEARAQSHVPDPTKIPFVVENQGTIAGLTIKGGGLKNDPGGVINNAILDLRPWFDFLLQESASNRKLETALQEKDAELKVRWGGNMSSDERLKEMSEFHEIERQLRAAQNDPDKLRLLLRRFRGGGSLL